MSIAGIYKITSPSGKFYIGQSKNIYKRLYSYSSAHCENQKHLYYSIKKYGWSSHIIDILHELPKDVTLEVLNTYERLYIQQYQTNLFRFPNGNGMNLTDGGDGTGGHKHSKEECKKIGERLKGNKIWLGRRHTAETIQKMKEKRKGQKTGLGSKRTPEQKEKMRLLKNRLGKKDSLNTKIQKSESANKKWEEIKNGARKAPNFKKTDEFKKHMSEILKGRKRAPYKLRGIKRTKEQSLAQSERQKGRKLSEITKNKIREKALLRKKMSNYLVTYL